MSAASHPELRLVGQDDPLAADAWRDEQRARLEVIKENRIAAHASGLDPTDPRWVLAMQTKARLQGATLTPERRDELIQSGKRLGLRPFEANLVIAIVQDRARAGLPLAQAAPPLTLVRAPEEQPLEPSVWPKWFAAAAAAAAVTAVLIRWLAG